jgi:hypothetical protein
MMKAPSPFMKTAANGCFWAASGRAPAMTDPKANNTRGGPLYDFVNAVVVCLNVRGAEKPNTGNKAEAGP